MTGLFTKNLEIELDVVSISHVQPFGNIQNPTELSEPSQKNSVIPFLKWAGGKRWLIKKHPELFDLPFKRYIEPFVGSAAVFFHLAPSESILSDKNKNLIDTYRAIRNEHEKISKELWLHQRKHCKDYYYEIRSKRFRSAYKKAAQFIYLNRTCWNGLYRVNQQNIFNVPKGTKDKVIIDTDDFSATAKNLKNTTLIDGDFSIAISEARHGDLLFVDPPYTVKHDKNGFIKYNETLFSWDDQVRLRDSVLAAKRRGANIILTNANHSSVRELYEGDFEIDVLNRSSVLSGKKENRGPVKELLVKWRCDV